MADWTQDEIDDDMFRYDDEDDEPELIIVCPDDMCRGMFDGEGPPCGKWDKGCVRYKERPATASGDSHSEGGS
jgi:hypothetical protein